MNTCGIHIYTEYENGICPQCNREDIASSHEGDPHKMVCEFPNEEAAKQFQLWMCNSGEQYYWENLDIREEPCLQPDYCGYDGSMIKFAILNDET